MLAGSNPMQEGCWYRRLTSGAACVQMLYWFKKSGLGTTLADVQQLFLKFRSRGMRLHYWP